MFHMTRDGVAKNGAHRAADAGFDGLVEAMTRGFEWMPAPAAELSPSLDVSETAGDWRIRAELPGIAPEDFEVTVTGNVVTIRGEKKSETKAEGEHVRRGERRYGKFLRSLEFPTDLDAAKVEARVKNGVLTVALPKAQASLPKTVAIQVG